MDYFSLLCRREQNATKYSFMFRRDSNVHHTGILEGRCSWSSGGQGSIGSGASTVCLNTIPDPPVQFRKPPNLDWLDWRVRWSLIYQKTRVTTAPPWGHDLNALMRQPFNGFISPSSRSRGLMWQPFQHLSYPWSQCPYTVAFQSSQKVTYISWKCYWIRPWPYVIRPFLQAIWAHNIHDKAVIFALLSLFWPKYTTCQHHCELNSFAIEPK